MKKLLDDAIKELLEKREEYISEYDADFVAEMLQLIDKFYACDHSTSKNHLTKE